VAFLALCLLFSANSVLADAKGDAQKRFRNGKELMKMEDFSGAAAELEQSVAIYPTKNGLFNLANCYKALHRYGDALATYARLQAEFKDKLDREMVGVISEDVEQIRGLVGELEVRVNHPGADVYVDDQSVGKSPLDKPLYLGPGEHTVKASLENYQTAQERVQIVSGDKNAVTLSLQTAQAAQEAEAAPATGLLDETAPAAAQTEQQPSAEQSGDTPARLTPYAWVTGGLTVATGATAIVFWVVSAGKHSKWQDSVDSAQKANTPVTEEQAKSSPFKDWEDDSKMYGGLAIGFGVAAGVFAAATVALFVIDSSLQSEKSSEASLLIPGQVGFRF